MFRYTANYIKTNSSFVIQNVRQGENNEKDIYSPVICVLKNILQRGCPTKMSSYLIAKIGNVDIDKERIKLIDKEMPIWINTIKGDEEHNDNPAKDFFEKLIPKFLPQFSFIQQLILPEAYIDEITGFDTEKFVDEQVDFYLPQAKLVIEIDGQQHEDNEIIKENDKKRDRCLERFGIQTVRISTDAVRFQNDKFREKINIIYSRLIEYKELIFPNAEAISAYEDDYELNELIPTAVIRFQLLILTLIQNNRLDLNNKEWNINLYERDVEDFAEIAIEDLFLWLENLCKLAKIDFRRPEYNINYFQNDEQLKNNGTDVNIDFSILKRWTDEDVYNENIVYVRNDYFDDKNYFEVSTADPIQYNIINIDGDKSKDALMFLVKNIFGYKDFNDGQLPIIISALNGENTIGLLPTGGGKSLCYQLTALLQPAISFIICPTKALMVDQKENLDAINITNTNYINSSQKPKEKEEILINFGKGKYLFIWISPERFQSKKFRQQVESINHSKRIALVVIDEVHCLSEWGHDFRTSYLTLVNTIKKYCPMARLLGLTATASRAVIKDLIAEFSLNIDNPKKSEEVSVKIPLKYTREELNFIIKSDNGESNDLKWKTLVSILNNLENKRDVFDTNGDETLSGLIFVPHVNGDFGCYKLSQRISREFNKDVGWFSGDVPVEYINNLRIPIMSREVFETQVAGAQKKFKNNDIPLLVATKAFGMGIDKKNIRYTIHYGVPISVEQLYQEAGRAGRDKGDAGCYILYSKERIQKEDIAKIFDRNASIEDIKALIESIGRKQGRDIYRDMFLWISNLNGIDDEVALAKKLFLRYATRNEEKLIRSKELMQTNFNFQKAIYRLSLLGIIEDWTIEDWSENNGAYEVKFTDYTEETIYMNLINYIQKYDTEFGLDKAKDGTEEYGKYVEIYNDNKLEYVEKILKILITWVYDNIIYQRRQALKTLYDLCENFTDGVSFKKAVESYFIFNEKTVVLDHISENPNDYENWFKVFYDEKKERLLNYGEIVELSNAIRRFLETYRFNLGLDFISGIVELIANKSSKDVKNERLERAVKRISNMDKIAIDYILSETFKLSSKIDNDDNKNYLSYCLCSGFPDMIDEVYKNLNDNHSLNLLLVNSIERVAGLKRRIV